jgi:hypothetical protein
MLCSWAKIFNVQSASVCGLTTIQAFVQQIQQVLLVKGIVKRLGNKADLLRFMRNWAVKNSGVIRWRNSLV